MKVKLYKPQNPLLRQYIECFYTLRRTSEEENIEYLAFPSVFSMVCLNAKAQIEFLKQDSLFTYCPHSGVQTSLVCSFGPATGLQYVGATDEIVIYFKPLGLNAFLETPLSHYMSSYFVKFSPFADYRAAMTDIFALEGDERRIRSLENYWASKHRGFEHPFLHEVVSEIIRSGGTASISEIACRMGISRPTLNKHFNEHLWTTPSQFKKIIRFRNAMKFHHQKIAAENLTDISSGAEYFDQSHMIKDFKTLTTYSPKNFFSKISILEDGYINWMFS